MDAHRRSTRHPRAATAAAPASSPRTRAQRLGDAGESAALAFLVARGLRPLARNVRFKAGELDLVMLDGEVLVFVEVRHRGRADFGAALDSIDARKARRIALAATLYRQRHSQHGRRACRFDVVAFDGAGARSAADAPTAAQWVRGAFTLDDL
ncbi:MAG TPA: YraN family protein [Xanthomonadaceae bacterium]|jgi:putative endonuclease|nr:YraN family protein [Xanthomonadaceae bacterium]